MFLAVARYVTWGNDSSNLSRNGVARQVARIIAQYRAFSHDVTAAMLVFQNKGMPAMMVYQTNPPGIEHFFMQILAFVSVKRSITAP